MKRFVLSLGLLIVVSLAPFRTEADVLTVSPSEVAVLPSNGDGFARIALLFDLSTMRNGVGRRIDNANIEWTLNGLPGDRETEFSVREITGQWDAEKVGNGVEEVSIPDQAADKWPITPRSYESIGGFVRLDLETVVRQWTSGVTANYGVLVATDALDRDAIQLEVQNVKLVVRYGFRP